MLEIAAANSCRGMEMSSNPFESHPGIDNDHGDAKFVQLWKYEDGRWWLTVVISYDHNRTGEPKTLKAKGLTVAMSAAACDRLVEAPPL